jgi:uncharacterized membrane protein
VGVGEAWGMGGIVLLVFGYDFPIAIFFYFFVAMDKNRAKASV